MTYDNQKQTEKAVLPLLVTSIIDHCNLNCKGCGSCAPIADKKFITLAQYIKDMDRISELFDQIDEIQIQGGETLLYPDLEQVISITRRIFPSTPTIKIITNAILLANMEEHFWATLRKHSVGIEVTIYPPFVKRIEEFKILAQSKNVPISFRNTSKFFKGLNLKGDGDYLDAFKKCKWKQCRFLRNGEISTCSAPTLRRIFAEKFNKNLIIDGVMDIHNSELTGLKLLKFFDTPFEHCKYCAEQHYFDWDVSKQEEQEWCVD